MPQVVFICGCNGSGKSTLRDATNLDTNIPVIDPDRLAFGGGLSAIAAGKEAANRAKQFIANKVDFARESTLSASFDCRLAEMAKSNGYTVSLIYMGLESPEMAVERVKNRHLNGGHFVPTNDVVRRYHRSLENIMPMLKKVDTAAFYDNSDLSYRLVIKLADKKVQEINLPLPVWLTKGFQITPKQVITKEAITTHLTAPLASQNLI